MVRPCLSALPLHLLPRERPSVKELARPAIARMAMSFADFLRDACLHLPGRERHSRGAGYSRGPAARLEWKQISFASRSSPGLCLSLSLSLPRGASVCAVEAADRLPGLHQVDLWWRLDRCPRQYGAAISLLSSA